MNPTNTLLRPLVIAVCLCCPALSIAQVDFEHVATLSGNGGPSFWFGDNFGTQIASSDGWLFVGAFSESTDVSGDGDDEFRVGSVYIYRQDEAGAFVFHQKLSGEGNSSPEINFIGDRFGSGLAVMGEWLFVVARNDTDFGGAIDPHEQACLQDWGEPFVFAGQVHVFRFNGLTQYWEGPVQKLRAETPMCGGNFGGRTFSPSLALFATEPNTENPNLAVIGEIGFAFNDGRLNVFRLDESDQATPWQRIQEADQFNVDGLIFADKIVPVGPAKDHFITFERDSNTFASFVHLYRIDGNGIVPNGAGLLRPIQSLVDASGSLGSGGIAGDGSRVVIADPFADVGAIVSAGVINIYDFDESGAAPLDLISQSASPSPVDFGQLGLGLGNTAYTIDVEDQLIGVGSTADFTGNAIVFEYDSSGVLDATITIPNPDPSGSLFGQAVRFLGENRMAIGQPNWFAHLQPQDNFGAVYIFSRHPRDLVLLLIEKVTQINLQPGIANSLYAKLDAVLAALDDMNSNNNGAAIGALQAFINAVTAQRGKTISEMEADSLIESAESIIELLSL